MNIFYRLMLGFSLFGTVVTAAAECNTSLKKSFNADDVVIVENGTVVDSSTGLMWMRCSLGYSWQDDTCERDASQANEFTWSDALAITNEKQFAGYDDWRLPNKIELDSIVERACFAPAINETLFPQTEAKGYWTNTPNNFNNAFAWAVNFASGEHISTGRTNLFAARLVRQVN